MKKAISKIWGLGMCTAVMLGGAVLAQETKTDMPAVETLMNKMIEATGGEAAYKAIKTVTIKGEMNMEAMGMKGKLTSYGMAPNKAMNIMELDNFGTQKQGTNGEIAWDVNPMTGPRLLEGEEKAVFLRQTAFNAALKWKELYKEHKVVGMEKVGEANCYKIEMTPHVGKKETWFMDSSSHLVIQNKMTVESPMGEMTVTNSFQDFKTTNGIKSATKMVQNTMGMEAVIKFTEVKYNAELPADTFAIPAEIQKILDKEKKTEDTKKEGKG